MVILLYATIVANILNTLYYMFSINTCNNSTDLTRVQATSSLLK